MISARNYNLPFLAKFCMLQSQVTDVIAVIQEKAMKENSRNLYAVLFSKISVGFATFLFLTLFCSNFAQANVRTNRQTQALF